MSNHPMFIFRCIVVFKDGEIWDVKVRMKENDGDAALRRLLSSIDEPEKADWVYAFGSSNPSTFGMTVEEFEYWHMTR